MLALKRTRIIVILLTQMLVHDRNLSRRSVEAFPECHVYKPFKNNKANKVVSARNVRQIGEETASADIFA
jgi:hypothetical protein